MVFSKWFQSMKNIKENNMSEFNAVEHGKKLAKDHLKQEEIKKEQENSAFLKLQKMLNLDDNYTIQICNGSMYIVSNMTTNKIKIYYVSRDISGLNSMIGYDVKDISDRNIIVGGLLQDVNNLCIDIYLYLSGQA